MKIFKNYLKIVNKHKMTIGLYFIIFFIVVLGVAQSAKTESKQFEAYKPKIYFENKSESLVSKKLEEVLKEYTIFSEETDKDIVKDELSYQMISAIVIIPEDFAISKKISVQKAANTRTGFLVEQTINNYLNKVNSYIKADFEEEKALILASEDIKKTVNVEYLKKQDVSDYGIQSYFNMLNYTIMSQVILVVTMLMAAFNKKQIADRNNISPMSKTRFVIELTLGHVVVSFLIWLSYIIVFIIMWPDAMKLKATYMMMGNSLFLTIITTTLGILLSNLVTTDGAIQGVMNVVSLGSSFLSGAFVPQEFMNKTILNFSKVFPSYYYVRNNSLIATDYKNPEIIRNAIIMLVFMIVFIALNILIKSRKKKAS